MALAMLYANEERYRGLLVEAVGEITKGPNKYTQLACMNEPDRLRIATSVLMSKDRREMNLIYPPQSPEETPEEIVLNVQGYLVQSHLPPITTLSQLGRSPVTARQTVTLSGLGTEDFGKALLAIVKIQQQFADKCGQSDFQSWEPHRERGYATLTLGNRYLSSPESECQDDVVDMETIDPYSILRDAVPSALHTRENQVLYFERRGIEFADSVYCPISPSAVKIGSLVEVQMAFGTTLTKKNKHVLLAKMRSICVLHRAVEDDISYTTLQSFVGVRGGTVRTLKRRVGYGDNAEAVESRMKKLKLTDAPVKP